MRILERKIIKRLVYGVDESVLREEGSFFEGTAQSEAAFCVGFFGWERGLQYFNYSLRRSNFIRSFELYNICQWRINARKRT